MRFLFLEAKLDCRINIFMESQTDVIPLLAFGNVITLEELLNAGTPAILYSTAQGLAAHTFVTIA